MNNTPNLKAAVAGIGFIGPVHIEALRRIPGVQVVAIVHSNEVYAAIKNPEKRVDPLYPSFKNGIREMELCEKVIESHHSQCWVKV